MFASISLFFADILAFLFGVGWKVILVWSIPFILSFLSFLLSYSRLKKADLKRRNKYE